jgi:uncharacterized membrane protein YeaQ/YmgE (transglycosylase-associated protein family)
MHTMIMSIIEWIVFGLIAGAIARMVYPGPNPMSWVATTILGMLGSLVGGGLAYLLRLGTSPYDPAGWILSILGAIILLAVAHFVTKRRATTF